MFIFIAKNTELSVATLLCFLCFLNYNECTVYFLRVDPCTHYALQFFLLLLSGLHHKLKGLKNFSMSPGLCKGGQCLLVYDTTRGLTQIWNLAVCWDSRYFHHFLFFHFIINYSREKGKREKSDVIISMGIGFWIGISCAMFRQSYFQHTNCH